MKGIEVVIPKKVFFSKDPENYIVKNDFYFSIFKGICREKEGQNLIPVFRERMKTCHEIKSEKKKTGEKYPTIYIKGFEQLFREDSMRKNQLEAFFKMFYVNGDWNICYGKFRDTEESCVVITCAEDTLEENFTVTFLLSDKCSFSEIPDSDTNITLQVFVDDFHYYFDDLQQQESYQILLMRGFAVYVEQFGAYRDAFQNPVTAVCKGEMVDISWKIEPNQKASSFLYDENGLIVANLPPYRVQIDRDRKFTLTAYNDFCSVSKTIHVYRTLWKKSDDEFQGFPQSDIKGKHKFFRRYDDRYYWYVHPNLYYSHDLKTWYLCKTNSEAPADFRFYSSACSERLFGVCYINSNKFIYCQMDFERKIWNMQEMEISGLLEAYVFLNDKVPIIVLATKEDIGFFELIGGMLMNGKYLMKPENRRIMSLDVLEEGTSQYLAVLYDNSRVYFYDLMDDYKNNIFEYPEVTDECVYLVKSNTIYIISGKMVYEVNDREKFTDIHFFPEYMHETYPVIGAAGYDKITGFFQTKNGMEMWEYQF